MIYNARAKSLFYSLNFLFRDVPVVIVVFFNSLFDKKNEGREDEILIKVLQGFIPKVLSLSNKPRVCCTVFVEDETASEAVWVVPVIKIRWYHKIGYL